MAKHDWKEKLFGVFNNNSYTPIISTENKVRIDHNINTKIENVNIIQVSHLIPVLVSTNHSLRKELIHLEENGKVFHDSKNGEIFKVEKLRNLYSTISKTFQQPTVRMRALFSGFSTIREPSNTDDMSVLELDEKKVLYDLVTKGCYFKLILNLDIMKAIVCGYNKEEIACRIGDLCNICDSLSETTNFDIVIDDLSYEPVWTIDEILIHRQLQFNQRTNYEISLWDSNIHDIRAFNSKFDTDFLNLKAQKESLCRIEQIDTIAGWIFYYTSQWMKNHPNAFEQE